MIFLKYNVSIYSCVYLASVFYWSKYFFLLILRKNN